MDNIPMRVVVLSSGSKGNTTYIEAGNKKILIDVGNSCRYISDSLKEIDIDPSDIDIILITHTHKDHIAGLETFSKKYNPIIYLTKNMLKSIPWLENYCLIEETNFLIDEIEIEALKISHDVEARGYIITHKDKSLAYITDTGYLNKKYFDKLKNKNLYIMESNHDIEMLMNGSYPFELKKRIVSDKGHLSNHASSMYLKEFIGTDTKAIVLAHLSEENNRPELAYQELINTLDGSYSNKIVIAKQNEKSELISI